MTKKNIGKLVFCLLFLFDMQISTAQIVGAEVGVNGLTCSQCSRSVELQFRKLPFVADVSMDLKHTTGKIVFKNNRQVDLEELPKAVKDAGFSTRYVRVTFDFSAIRPEHQCFSLGKDVFYLIDSLASSHTDTMEFQVVGKGFLPAKELKGYRLRASGDCSGNPKYYLKAL